MIPHKSTRCGKSLGGKIAQPIDQSLLSNDSDDENNLPISNGSHIRVAFKNKQAMEHHYCGGDGW